MYQKVAQEMLPMATRPITVTQRTSKPEAEENRNLIQLRKCKHEDDSCGFYYYDPICKLTGKMCTNKVHPCKHKSEGMWDGG